MNLLDHVHPILSSAESRAYEATILTGEDAGWEAMRRAGNGVAEAVLEDYQELGEVPQAMRILVLVGKGNNAGDALLAAGRLLAEMPRASVQLWLAQAEEAMGAQARRALRQLEGRVRLSVVDAGLTEDEVVQQLQSFAGEGGFDLCIDGLLGMAFEPPVRMPMSAMIRAVNGCASIRVRVSVDLPSGCSDVRDETVFRADFTYATGIAKAALFESRPECGRIRYLDIGFFSHDAAEALRVDQYVVSRSILDSMQRLRSSFADKRDFGHVFILGGSSFMPGALLMAVQAAVRSGAGLVTAFAPVSVASTLAAQVPEAMWVPWPETASGSLNPKALPLLMERVEAADVVVVGPGMGKDRSTTMIAQEVVKSVDCPVLLDADALRRRVVEWVRKRRSHMGPVVLTPHQGEYMRIAKLTTPDWSAPTLRSFSQSMNVLTVLKGPQTRICDQRAVYINTFGGPVLSRGGSGDLLAGIMGGLIAQNGADVSTAVVRAVALHGAAAECLARSKGQVAVRTTELLDYLSAVIH